jgi:hypothetical protein
VRPGVPDCQIHLNVPAGNVAGRIITNAPSAFFTVVMLIIIGRKSNEPANPATVHLATKHPSLQFSIMYWNHLQ